MKARKRGCYTITEARREVERETNAVYEEIFRACAADITAQITATVLYTLMSYHDWGKVRLTRFVDELKDVQQLMDSPGRLHHKFDPLELQKMMLDKYGIDLQKEFPAKVEIKF